MKKNINIMKVMYCGNGYSNNIGYYVWFENDLGHKVFIPALNNTSYNEHYAETVIDEGVHLYKEAEQCLKNAFTNDNNTLESYFTWSYKCEKDINCTPIEPDEMI